MIAAAHRPIPGASAAAAHIVELHARLRLACHAIGCEPEDVRVDDLAPREAMRLREDARGDFWAFLAGDMP